jgi:hypothetical protein
MDRRGHEDMTVARDDLRQRGAHGAPHAEQVHLGPPLERGLVDRRDRRRRIGGDAGVCEHHVQSTEAFDGHPDHRVARPPVGDVTAAARARPSPSSCANRSTVSR